LRESGNSSIFCDAQAVILQPFTVIAAMPEAAVRGASTGAQVDQANRLPSISASAAQ
jgi:hypothetical protein